MNRLLDWETATASWAPVSWAAVRKRWHPRRLRAHAIDAVEATKLGLLKQAARLPGWAGKSQLREGAPS